MQALPIWLREKVLGAFEGSASGLKYESYLQCGFHDNYLSIKFYKMKRITFFLLALCCAIVTQAQTVVATMQDLVSGAASNTATVSTDWQVDNANGAVYAFDGTASYIGGITSDAVVSALEGNQYVTIAMWVYTETTDNGKCALHLVILATRTRRSSISPPARTCRQKRTEFSLTPDRKLSMPDLIHVATVIHRLKKHGIIEKHRIGWGLILFQFWCKMSP